MDITILVGRTRRQGHRTSHQKKKLYRETEKIGLTIKFACQLLFITEKLKRWSGLVG